MPNPIYILQLTDWHFSNDSKLIPQEFLKKNLRKFLDKKGRQFVDVMTITGDMVDKDGAFLHSKNHDIAAQFINNLADDFLPKDKNLRRIYCAAGNHDLDSAKCLDLLKSEIDSLSNPKFKKYSIVDDNAEILKECFSNYKKFAEDINSFNKENPFNGAQEIDFGKFRIFLSWFNTAWLCMAPEYKKLNNPKLTTDYEILSVGNSINKKIYDSLERFIEENHERAFSMSISHHYPRLLNWFDKNDQDKGDEVHKCYYSHVKKYSLVLNGHTHGRLFDKPFMTCPGVNTIESGLVYKDVFLYEVDVIRNSIILYAIPLENDIDLENIYRRFFVYNDVSFIEDIKKDYTNKDLFKDLLYNGCIDDKEISNSLFDTNVDVFDLEDNQIMNFLYNIGIDETILVKDPLWIKRKKTEIQAFKYKLKDSIG